MSNNVAIATATGTIIDLATVTQGIAKKSLSLDWVTVTATSGVITVDFRLNSASDPIFLTASSSLGQTIPIDLDMEINKNLHVTINNAGGGGTGSVSVGWS